MEQTGYKPIKLKAQQKVEDLDEKVNAEDKILKIKIDIFLSSCQGPFIHIGDYQHN